MIIRLIPGDLVEFWDDANIFLILSIEDGAISYLRSLNDGETPIIVEVGNGWGYQAGNLDGCYDRIGDFYACRKEIKSVRHLFDFNMYSSVVCSESICFPRQINGECSGCPLGSVMGPKVKNLYLPDDEVYVIREKKVRVVSQVALSIKGVAGHTIFKCSGLRPAYRPQSWSLQDFINLMSDYRNRGELPGLTLEEAWKILKNPRDYYAEFECRPRFYIEKDNSGRWAEDIRLRERGRHQYLNLADFDTICGICIYQGDLRTCDKCSIRYIKTKYYGKSN